MDNDEDGEGIVEEYRIPLADLPSPTFSGIDLIPPSREGGDEEEDGQEAFAMLPLHSEGGGGVYMSVGDPSPMPVAGPSPAVHHPTQQNGHVHLLPPSTNGGGSDGGSDYYIKQSPHVSGMEPALAPGGSDPDGLQSPEVEQALNVEGAIFIPWVSVLVTGAVSTIALWVTSSAATVSCSTRFMFHFVDRLYLGFHVFYHDEHVRICLCPG